MADTDADMQREIDALKAENGRLREALKPFATLHRSPLTPENYCTHCTTLAPIGEAFRHGFNCPVGNAMFALASKETGSE